MSIALEVCRMAEARVGPDRLDALVVVALDVGDESGVEVGSLEFCLASLLTQLPFRAATPLLNRVPGDVLRLTYLEVDDGG